VLSWTLNVHLLLSSIARFVGLLAGLSVIRVDKNYERIFIEFWTATVNSPKHIKQQASMFGYKNLFSKQTVKQTVEIRIQIPEWMVNDRRRRNERELKIDQCKLSAEDYRNAHG